MGEELMAKRFIDTEAYEDVWFRKLPMELKLLWYYMICQCDMAGVWKVDLEKAEFNIKGKSPEPDKILKAFNEKKTRIQVLDDERWWVTEFIKFQYVKLGTKSNIHINVIKIILNDRIEKEVIATYPYMQGILEGYRTRVEPESNSPSTQVERLTSKSKSKSKGKSKNVGILIKGAELLDITEKIILDLNTVGGRQFRVTDKVKKWVKARLNEGFTFDDFQQVHRKKFIEWGNDPDMAKYYRPETLYGNKFDAYLNQPEMTRSKATKTQMANIESLAKLNAKMKGQADET